MDENWGYPLFRKPRILCWKLSRLGEFLGGFHHIHVFWRKHPGAQVLDLQEPCRIFPSINVQTGQTISSRAMFAYKKWFIPASRARLKKMHMRNYMWPIVASWFIIADILFMLSIIEASAASLNQYGSIWGFPKMRIHANHACVFRFSMHIVV